MRGRIAPSVQGRKEPSDVFAPPFSSGSAPNGNSPFSLDHRTMTGTSFIIGLLYRARNLRSRTMFAALRRYCRGHVLDVGGWDFYRTATARGIRPDSWTVLEVSAAQLPATNDGTIGFVIGDGCAMGFQDGSFDTVLNIQVLEHVFEPLAMIDEMARVLKDNGHMILLVPQTATLHMAPHHYHNFTRFWIEEALRRAGLSILELKPLGGIWSSMASHCVYFFLQSARFPGMSTPACRRTVFFYLFYPLMVLFALLTIPLCMLLSIGDLTEEPNNHLVVAVKGPPPANRSADAHPNTSPKRRESSSA